MKILLIEDNEMIIKGITFLLEEHGYFVDVAVSLNKAKDLITNFYDLVILDLMLPDGDGYTFFKEYIEIPTLVLSAKDEEEDIVSLLDAGAVDYIVKPFRSKELLSRINGIIKRSKKDTLIEFENLKLDTLSYKVYKDSEEVVLTGLELKILFFLIENAGIIVRRETILDKIWDASGKFVEDNTLTVYIKRIREKLGNDNLIKTIKGIGYRVDLWKRS